MRNLTDGERELVALALDIETRKLKAQALQHLATANRYRERNRGDSSKSVEILESAATELEAKALASSNLAYAIRKYGASLNAPLYLPEQA